MSNQILISSGAKLRDLDDVIIGTDGVLSSLGFDVPYGVPRLDANGKILVSELPNSVMEFKGVWNAATNTPTLTNGVGNAGDVYLCNVAGTVNFGAGPITFAVGDYAVYTGSVWARSSGAVGTVTSVAVSRDGDALAITGSPITSSGTINIGFTGTSAQYINGAGNLTTFPSLTGFVPYTGATQNVDLGTYGLLSDYLQLNTSPSSVPTSVGTMSWDSFYKTLQIVTGDGDTTLQVGQEQVTLIHNNTGSTLTDGQVVYVTGSTGQLPTVALASNTTEATSSVTFGVVTESIANGADGFITTSGMVHGLNTLAYNEGDALYLGATAGTFTNVKPSAPNNLVLIGYMIKKAGGNGSIFVKIQNGYEISELHDVLITSIANNDGLFYNSSTSLWENKTVAEVLGYTPANDNLVVHKAGAETITGIKTFTNEQLFGNGITLTGGYITYEDNTYNLTLNTNILTANRNLYLPDASGTIALTSDLTGGTVTSVGLSAPTGFSVSGSPVTVSGTLALSFASGYSLPTNVKQSNWDDAYTWVAAFPTQTGNAGKFLTTNGSILSWADNPLGTVTSVAMTVPTGLTVSGSPITTSGTLAVSLTAGYSIPTTANQANWTTAYNDSIISAAVTGTTTKTLTLNQQDGGTVTASWTDYDTAPVTSVFGRTGAVVAMEGDYTLTQLGDVTITTPTTGQVLKYNGTTWINDTDANTGTVTSVGMTVPTGLSVAGSPITSAGTLAVTFTTGYSIPTNASQTNWDTAYTNRITSLTTTGSSGSATLVSNTLNIPTYTLAGLGGVPTTRTLTINGVAYDLSADRTWTIAAGISSVSGTAPISVSTVSGAATVSIATANSTTTGALSSTDWNTFNNKQNALTNPITGTGTANKVAKFSGTTTLVDSSITDAAGEQMRIVKDAATSSSYLVSIYPTTGTNASILNLDNSGAGSFFIGRANSTGGNPLVSVGAYDSVIGHTGSQILYFITNSLVRLAINGSGDATFSGAINFNNGSITSSGELTFNSSSPNIYTYGRYGLTPNGGRIIFNNGTGANMFFGEIATHVYGFTPSAYNSSPVLTFNLNTLNVGIGTSSANQNLEISYITGVRNTAILRLNSSAGGQNNSIEYAQGGSVKWEVGSGMATSSDYEIRDRVNSANRITINSSSGNVLIGTTTDAGYKLDVIGSGRFYLSTYQKIETYFSSPYTSGFKFSDNNGQIVFNAGTDNMNITSNAAGGNITFGTVSTTRLTIGSTGTSTFTSGNEIIARFFASGDGTIIIGGTAAQGASSGEQYITYQNATTNTNAWMVGMDDGEDFRFAYGAQGEITDGNSLVKLSQGGNLSIGTITDNGTRLNVYSNGNTGIYLTQATNQADAVVVNVTATSYNKAAYVAAVADSASVIGFFYYGQANGVKTYAVYPNGNVQNTNGSYGTLSDSRVKQNIVDATPKLESLLKVRIVNYNLIAPYNQEKQIGVVAQELEKIFPSMVYSDMDGVKGVKYSIFIPMLIKAIQEQNETITQLKQEIQNLKNN